MNRFLVAFLNALIALPFSRGGDTGIVKITNRESPTKIFRGMSNNDDEKSKCPALKQREVQDFLKDIPVFTVVDSTGHPTIYGNQKQYTIGSDMDIYLFLDSDLAEKYFISQQRTASEKIREFSLGYIWTNYIVTDDQYFGEYFGEGLFIVNSTMSVVHYHLIPDYKEALYAMWIMFWRANGKEEHFVEEYWAAVIGSYNYDDPPINFFLSDFSKRFGYPMSKSSPVYTAPDHLRSDGKVLLFMCYEDWKSYVSTYIQTDLDYYLNKDDELLESFVSFLQFSPDIHEETSSNLRDHFTLVPCTRHVMAVTEYRKILEEHPKEESIVFDEDDIREGLGEEERFHKRKAEFTALSREDQVKSFLRWKSVYAVVDFAGRPIHGDRKSFYFFSDLGMAVTYYHDVKRPRDKIRAFSLSEIWFKYLDGDGRILYNSELVKCRLVPDFREIEYAQSIKRGGTSDTAIADEQSIEEVWSRSPIEFLTLNGSEMIPVFLSSSSWFYESFHDIKMRKEKVIDVYDLHSLMQKISEVALVLGNMGDTYLIPDSRKELEWLEAILTKTTGKETFEKVKDKSDEVLFLKDFNKRVLYGGWSWVYTSMAVLIEYDLMRSLPRWWRYFSVIIFHPQLEEEEGDIYFRPGRQVEEMMKLKQEIDEMEGQWIFPFLFDLKWYLTMRWLFILSLFFVPIQFVKLIVWLVPRSRNMTKIPLPKLTGKNLKPLPIRAQGPVTSVSYRNLIEQVIGWLLLPFSLPLLISLTFLTYPMSFIRDTWLFFKKREFYKLLIVWITAILIVSCIMYAWASAVESYFVVTPYSLYIACEETISGIFSNSIKYNGLVVLVIVLVYGLPSFFEFFMVFLGINSPNPVHYIWKPVFCSLSFGGLIWDTFWPILNEKDVSKYEPEEYHPITMLVFTRQRKRKTFFGWGNLGYIFNPKLEYKYIFEPEWGNSILLWFFSRLPLNHGTNFKLYLFAKHFRTEEIRTLVNLPETNEGKLTSIRHLESLNMLRLQDRPFSLISKDEVSTLNDVKDYFEKGADLNFPNNLGQTMLHNMCQRRYNLCIEWLLSNGADPNSRDIEGCTPMHYLVSSKSSSWIPGYRKRFDSERRRAIELFLNYELSTNDREHTIPEKCNNEANFTNEKNSHSRHDTSIRPNISKRKQPSGVDLSILSSCDYIDGGASAYSVFQDRISLFSMSRFILSICGTYVCGIYWSMLIDPLLNFLPTIGRLDSHSESLEALRPKPSWNKVEEILDCKDPGIELLCEQIFNLIATSNPNGSRELHRLRLRDMLFCKKEGESNELRRRQETLFKRFLEPALKRSAEEPMIDDDLRKMLVYFFNESEDPRNKDLSRSAYQSEFHETIKFCDKKIKSYFREALDDLVILSEKNSNSYEFKLMNLEEEAIHSDLYERDLNHGRFMKPPSWAVQQDLAGAVYALHQVGVINSIEMFCELIQQGRNPLLPNPNPQLFHKGPSSPDFWIALVLLWSIGIQTKIQDEFNKKMRDVDAKAFQAAPGVKKFPRSFEKALEYAKDKNLNRWEEKVCAGLHVIDGLRCKFVMNTAEENIALGHRLEERFPIARTKSSHKLENDGYADRKYNIVYSSSLEGVGNVAFICEVQILMKRYVEIGEVDHLHYEFQRSEQAESPKYENLLAFCGRFLYFLAIVFTSFPGFICLLVLAPQFDVLKNFQSGVNRVHDRIEQLNSVLDDSRIFSLNESEALDGIRRGNVPRRGNVTVSRM